MQKAPQFNAGESSDRLGMDMAAHMHAAKAAAQTAGDGSASAFGSTGRFAQDVPDVKVLENSM